MLSDKSSNKSLVNISSDDTYSKDAIPFDLLVQANEAGIFYLNNSEIIYANDTFIKILGIPADVILGFSIIDAIRDEGQKRFEKGLLELISGERDSFSDEFQLKNEDSYFSVHLRVNTRSEGKVTLIGASRNATARVKRYKSLMDTKSMLNSLYNNLVDGIFIYDYDKEEIIDCNDSALKIFAYEEKKGLLKKSRSEFVPRYSKIFPGVDFFAATEDHGDRVRKGESFKTPGIFIKKNGEHIIVHASVVPTFRHTAEAFIIFQDSTERVNEKLIQKAAEEKYREIFQNSHEGIIYTDVKSKEPIICNDKALKIFGVSSLEELKKIKPEDFIVNEKELNLIEVYNEKIKKAITSGKADFSFWMKKKSGEIVRISGIFISGRSEKGKLKIISFLRDVTNLYEARIELNEKNEELRKYINSNLQLENFAYFASHDLQTPLRGMISFTQLLKKSLEDKISGKEEEYMDHIIGSSKNMRNLINDLLSYSRVNTAEINIVKFDLTRMLQELITSFQNPAEEKKIHIALQNLPQYITADPIKLKQVFQNLISNAIKFSQEEELIKVTIDCEENKHHWLFSVKDNGIGIDIEFYDKIFLLFKRLHTIDKYEGTGIGLAIVKKIVEQHNGKIFVESEFEKGSTFSFTIKKP